MKATIIGGGNTGVAVAEGLIEAKVCNAADIIITRRTESSLDSLRAKGFEVSTNNAEAVKDADAVFICVLPQQLDVALTQLQSSINLQKQLVVSVVTGAHTGAFREMLGKDLRIVAAMPNPAMR